MELFHNCADITIGSGIGSVGETSSPLTPLPSPVPVPSQTFSPQAPLPSGDGTPLPSPYPTPSPSNGSPSSSVCCSGEETGWYAANGCDGFVYCNNGSNVGYQSCAVGLKYDQAFGACNWAALVACPSSCDHSRRLEDKEQDHTQLRGDRNGEDRALQL